MNILQKSFKYVPSSETDIRKTFARIRKQIREEKEKQLEQISKVKVIYGHRTG